jgi:hypothetical protein
MFAVGVAAEKYSRGQNIALIIYAEITLRILWWRLGVSRSIVFAVQTFPDDGGGGPDVSAKGRKEAMTAHRHRPHRD